MALPAPSRPLARHPWLDDLVRQPEAELRALIGGYAEIAPFGRDEPPDAAMSLLYGIPDDDPARRAFDAGCLALFEALRREIVAAADADAYEGAVADFYRLLAVVRRAGPPDTLCDLHRRYLYWFHVVETSVVDRGLDPRREFWRLLALTQEAATPARRYLATWLEICAEAGPHGRYDLSYLDVGLMGLRRLPLGESDSSNEEPVCHGIARWAARQKPDKNLFLERWREVEAAYPRSPDYWPDLVEDTIAATEDYLTAETGHSVSFPAADWWRDELDLPRVKPDRKRILTGRRRDVAPPARELRETILRGAGNALSSLRPGIQRLMAGHRDYAEHTGETYYLVRTACNIGMRLIRREFADARVERGEIAISLAQYALRYAPHNVYAWALRRDGLATAGAFDDAETVGWETIRCYPENPNWRTQLALRLGQRRDRLDDAARLLRQTIDRFPGNAVARAQLSTVLADGLGQYAEAAALLRAAIQAFPDNAQSYNQLAILLADHLNEKDAAADVLRTLLGRDRGNEVAQNLMGHLLAGRRLRNAPRVPRPAPAAGATRSIGIGFDPAAAHARRALFQIETGGPRDRALHEIEALLAADAAHPYANFAARKAGSRAGAARFDTAFAFAFDRAARAGSAAAFDQLLTHVIGVDRMIVEAGRDLLSARWSPPDPAANDMETESQTRRFFTLKQSFRVFHARPELDPRPALDLLADFAGSRLAA